MDHTGVRPHPCTECKLTFKTSNSLKKHKLSVHSNIKHFVCQFCSSRFSTSSGVLRHQKKQRCSGLRPGDQLPAEDEEDKLELASDEKAFLQPTTLGLVKQESRLAWRGPSLSLGQEAFQPSMPSD